MLTARTSAGAARPDRALLWSLFGHGLLIALALTAGIVLHRTPPVTSLAIKATVVDRDALSQPAPKAPEKAAPEVPEKPAPKAPEKPVPPPVEPAPVDDSAIREQQAAAEAAQERAAAEKAKAEQARAEQAKAEKAAEKARADQLKAEQAKAEKAKADQAKAEKVREEKAKAEKLKAEKLKAEKLEAEEARREKEKADARAAAERKAKAAAEAAQRDMARQLAAEEDLHAAQASGALDAYVALIRQRVERNWTRPPSARPGLDCEVQVRQLPGGQVAGVQIGRCNGDEAVRLSIETAVLRASPLPLPDDPSLFERNLLFTFKPEQ